MTTKWNRERIQPKADNARSIKTYSDGKNALAYVVTTWTAIDTGRHYLLSYRGRRSKPDSYIVFLPVNEAARDNECHHLLCKYRARVEEAAKEKTRDNPLNVGDLFRCSWGYDQTNVDYYQVVGRTHRTVTVRAISCKSMRKTGWDSDVVRPLKGQFCGEPMRKRVQFLADGRPYLTMTSYSAAFQTYETETANRSWGH